MPEPKSFPGIFWSLPFFVFHSGASFADAGQIIKTFGLAHFIYLEIFIKKLPLFLFDFVKDLLFPLLFDLHLHDSYVYSLYTAWQILSIFWEY